MEYYKNTLCVSATWLVDNDIMTLDNYRALASRKHIHVIRRASRNTPALASYDSMPDRFKESIIEKIGGNPYDIVRLNILEDYIEPSTEASDFFESYKLSDGRYLPKQTRQEYYTNAILYDAIKRLIADKVSPKKVRGGKVSHSWQSISKYVQGLDRTVYPHTLVSHFSRLRENYNKYQTDGYETIIHKNFANQHAAKIDDQVKESLVIELLADPRNFDNERIARLYNQVAENAGWQKITGHTIANRRDKYDLEIHAGRRGMVSLSNEKLMQVKRFAPTRPLYYWTLDGWDVELLYQAVKNGVTTYTNRVTVVVVLDPCGKYPIGYAVGTHETPELIQAALRNAARHTAELFGSMYRAHQLQSDRYAIKKMTPLYEAMAKLSTPAKARNAKSKVIEPYFKYLNTEYCQLFRNWSGYGITSDKDNQPNEEALGYYKKDFPDYEGVCKMVDAIIMEERKKKFGEFLNHWDSMSNDDKLELSDESYLYHFGVSTGRTNLMQPDGLHVTLKGLPHTFDSFDILFRQHMSTQWSIMFDPADTSKVLAMNEDQTRRFVLEEKYLQPMALKDRKEGDSYELGRINTFNKEVKEHIMDFRVEAGNTVRDFFLQNKEVDGTLAKLVITDGNGQHKNNKNIGRGSNAIETRFKDVSLVEQKQTDIYDLM